MLYLPTIITFHCILYIFEWLGMDYLSDIAHWRSYCSIEDTLVKGRFSLRGSELGWAKSWLWNLGNYDLNFNPTT